MAQINLLPWREERRQELKKQFLVTLALVVALGAGLVLLGDRIVNSQIENQNARNAYLTENIKEIGQNHCRNSRLCRNGATSCWIACG